METGQVLKIQGSRDDEGKIELTSVEGFANLLFDPISCSVIGIPLLGLLKTLHCF
jgi:hypothetical protein